MDSKKSISILSFIILNMLVLAQTAKKSSNDSFYTALKIKDSIVGPVNVFKATDPEEIVYDSRPEVFIVKDNPAYFKFTIQKDSLLTFDIVPEDSKEDYDFLLYRCIDNTCIDEIIEKKIKPIRFCLSINEAKNSTTGLSTFSQLSGIGGGNGVAYASALPVKAGELYYLVVSYPEYYLRIQHKDFPKGFKIYFYDNWPKKKKPKVPVILEGVYFEQGKAVLKKESFVALDKLVQQLQHEKTMKIEIDGHTDNQGNQPANQKLSEMRAKTVRDYLISKNIDNQRLIFKGFGGTKPITSNETEEGRKKNRRVEFVILSK